MKNDPREKYAVKYKHGSIYPGTDAVIQHSSRDGNTVMYTLLYPNGMFSHQYSDEPIKKERCEVCKGQGIITKGRIMKGADCPCCHGTGIR